MLVKGATGEQGVTDGTVLKPVSNFIFEPLLACQRVKNGHATKNTMISEDSPNKHMQGLKSIELKLLQIMPRALRSDH